MQVAEPDFETRFGRLLSKSFFFLLKRKFQNLFFFLLETSEAKLPIWGSITSKYFSIIFRKQEQFNTLLLPSPQSAFKFGSYPNDGLCSICPYNSVYFIVERFLSLFWTFVNLVLLEIIRQLFCIMSLYLVLSIISSWFGLCTSSGGISQKCVLLIGPCHMLYNFSLTHY